MISSVNFARPRSRSGFTLIEVMVVVVVAGLIMAMTLPKFSATFDRVSVRSAKQQMTAYLAAARAAAIRQSQTSQFHVANNSIWTNVNQLGGTNINVTKTMSLKTMRGVTVTLSGSTANDSITYDSRGMSNTGSSKTYVLTRNNYKDSVCVSLLGLIARNCGQ
jgi:prepilin-type N-terminal cleavage/methylation domain-containing protein